MSQSRNLRTKQGNVFEIWTANGQATVEITTLNPPESLPSGWSNDTIEEKVLERINDMLESQGGILIEDRLLDQITQPAPEDPNAPTIVHVGAHILDQWLQVYGVADGTLPGAVSPVNVDSDMVMGVSAHMMEDQIAADALKEIKSTPPQKLNDNYKLVVKSISCDLIDGGFNFSGKATAVGEPNDWWEFFDWYKDIDAEFTDLKLMFTGINQPDGKFNFEQEGEPEVDCNNWDIFWFSFLGVITLGLTWGANPLFLFTTPIGSWIAGLVSFFNMEQTGLSTSIAAPDLPEDLAGAGLQFVDVRIDPKGMLLVASQTEDLAVSKMALTGSSQMRAKGSSTPERLSEEASIERVGESFWKYDRRYRSVWRLNGKVMYDGPFWEHGAHLLEPVTEEEVASTAGKITLTHRLYRRGDDRLEKLHHETKHKVTVIGPLGVIQDCYLSNTRSRKVHVASAEGRCYQIDYSHTCNRSWGLPIYTRRGEMIVSSGYTTCEDCFGAIVPLEDVVTELMQKAEGWPGNLPESWILQQVLDERAAAEEDAGSDGGSGLGFHIDPRAISDRIKWPIGKQPIQDTDSGSSSKDTGGHGWKGKKGWPFATSTTGKEESSGTPTRGKKKGSITIPTRGKKGWPFATPTTGKEESSGTPTRGEKKGSITSSTKGEKDRKDLEGSSSTKESSKDTEGKHASGSASTTKGSSRSNVAKGSGQSSSKGKGKSNFKQFKGPGAFSKFGRSSTSAKASTTKRRPASNRLPPRVKRRG